MQKNSTRNIPFLLTFLLFSSLGFGAFFLDIGFALKPYMAVIVLIGLYILFSLRRISLKVTRPFVYEVSYILLLFIVAISYLWSLYPDQTLRFTANALLLLAFYIILRIFFTNYIRYHNILRAVSWSGVIIAISSWIYYIAGVMSVDFVFSGNGIIEMGLMIDRGSPRFIGTASSDPNITAMFLAFPLIFYAVNKEKYITQLLLFLALILTFSRGAYIAISITMLAYLILNIRPVVNKTFIKRSIILVVVTVTALSFASSALGLNITNIAEERFDNVSSDGGSGRIDLWNKSLNTFKDNPTFGIGANSSLSYNTDYGDSAHYIHNSYLEILSELGLIGALCAITLICSVIWRVHMCSSSRKEKFFLQYFLLAIAIMITFLSVVTHEMIMISLVLLASASHALTPTNKNIRNNHV